jgi:hypothetical protein
MKSTLGVLLALALGAVPAWAVLGEYESSVSLDQQALGGERRELARQGYKVHQITTLDGTVVKEFVSPAGVVFGVNWQGAHLPDLQQLLGPSHMAELEQATQSRTRRHSGGPLIVRTDKLVFVSGGHMRSFHGYAYVPSLVPTHVAAEVVE